MDVVGHLAYLMLTKDAEAAQNFWHLVEVV